MPSSSGNSQSVESLISRRANWMKRSAQYMDGSRSASQKCEDLVARRIVMGLGYTEKGLVKLESKLDLQFDPVKTLMDRVRNVLDVLSNGMFSTDPDRRRMWLQVRETDRRHSAVFDNLDELAECAMSAREGMLLLGRVGDDRLAWGYVILPDGAMPAWLMQPPLCMLAKHNGYTFWYREVCDLFHDMAKYCRWDVE